MLNGNAYLGEITAGMVFESIHVIGPPRFREKLTVNKVEGGKVYCTRLPGAGPDFPPVAVWQYDTPFRNSYRRAR